MMQEDFDQPHTYTRAFIVLVIGLQAPIGGLFKAMMNTMKSYPHNSGQF